MSVFKERIDNFSKEHSLSPLSKLKLLLHYPLFKASWLEQHSKGLPKKISHWVIKGSGRYNLRLKVNTATKIKQNILVPFQWENLNSFQEIFFGREYEAPWDLSDCYTLVDAGANVGFASQYFLTKAPLKKIVQVEANPYLVPILKSRFEKQSLDCEIVFQEKCLSGRSGETLTFSINENHRDSGIGSMTDSEKSIVVKSISLKDLLSSQKLERVDILKMDIEGAEYDIQEQDPQVFENFRFLYFEVHGEKLKRDKFASGFDSRNFEIYRPEPSRHRDCEILFVKNKNCSK